MFEDDSVRGYVFIHVAASSFLNIVNLSTLMYLPSISFRGSKMLAWLARDVSINHVANLQVRLVNHGQTWESI